MDGFYEWHNKHVKGLSKPVKQPYFVHFDGKPYMLMAGLYDVWENEEGETTFSYTVLTTRSSKALAWLHDRMPVRGRRRRRATVRIAVRVRVVTPTCASPVCHAGAARQSRH